jgi:hypothetical protein
VDLDQLFSGFFSGDENPTLIVNTWEGEVILETDFGQKLSIFPGQTILYAGGGATPLQLDAPPDFIRQSPGPRPDRVPVDLDRLFDAVARSGTEPGFYVGVYDGDVVLFNEYGEVYLGKGEAGFAAFEPTRPIRLADQPLFLILDPYQSLSSTAEDEQKSLDLFDPDFGGIDVRKETECEIR